MTKNSLSDTAALRALLSETSDSNLLAEMLGFVADRLMALDVDQICGARTQRRPYEPPQRIPVQGSGNACGKGRRDDPEAAQGQLPARDP